MSEKLYRNRVKLANELGATRQQTFAVVKITTARSAPRCSKCHLLFNVDNELGVTLAEHEAVCFARPTYYSRIK